MIVDDHALFAEAIRATLQHAGHEVVGVAQTADEGVALARSEQPDVALVDLGLPDRSGLTVGRDVLETSPGTKVVALTGIDDPKTIREARRLGFHGYITKDTPVPRFSAALGDVLAGRVVQPRPRRTVRPAADRHVALLVDQLTDRERDVLELVVRGLHGRAIARNLGISPNTVRTHVQSVLGKLGVHSRLEAAAFAIRHGLVRVGDGDVPSYDDVRTNATQPDARVPERPDVASPQRSRKA